MLTYNLLADMLTYCEQFPHTQERHLAWAYRRDMQQTEMGYHAPSLICLQVSSPPLPPPPLPPPLPRPPAGPLPSPPPATHRSQELQGTPPGSADLADLDHRIAIDNYLKSRGYDGRCPFLPARPPARPLAALLPAARLRSRYARKTRDGSEWPSVQIGNALYWRQDTFDYLEHEVVPLSKASLPPLPPTYPPFPRPFGRPPCRCCLTPVMTRPRGSTLVVGVKSPSSWPSATARADAL